MFEQGAGAPQVDERPHVSLVLDDGASFQGIGFGAITPVSGVEGVDTRALTQRLRTRGVMGGRIVPGTAGSAQPEPDACDPRRLVPDVSVSEPQLLRAEHGRGPTIGVLDCGVKNNILRLLLERGADVLLLPWDADP